MNVFTPPADVMLVLDIMGKMRTADIDQILSCTKKAGHPMSRYKVVFILCLLEEFGAISLEGSPL